MKNINTIFNIILSIAVIVLFVLVMKKDGKSNETEAGKSDKEVTSTAPVKIEEKSSTIVFVNSDSLFAHYEFFKENQDLAEKERKALENTMTAKVKAFEAEVEDFKGKAQYMTQEQGLQKQQELMEKEQKLAEFRDVQSENILKKDQQRADSALTRVTRYLKTNYTKTGYTYILGYSHGGGILFSRDSLDITKEVIQGLNNEYKGKK